MINFSKEIASIIRISKINGPVLKHPNISCMFHINSIAEYILSFSPGMFFLPAFAQVLLSLLYQTSSTSCCWLLVTIDIFSLLLEGSSNKGAQQTDVLYG